MYKNIDKIRKNIAVSEIFAVILILTITASVFLTVNYLLLGNSGPLPEPSTVIYGKLKNDTLIIEPYRGSELSLDTICILNIGGVKNSYTVSNLLDTKSKDDGTWDIGERLIFQLGNFTYFMVSFQIINKERNVVLWDEIIQDGVTSQYPYIVLTLEPTNIKDGSAELWLGYNFRDKSGSVQFSYKELGGSWINTSWEPKSGSGTYNKTISGLSPDKIYIYRAQLNCESNTINGEEKSILQNGVTSIDTIIPYEIQISPLNIIADGTSFLDSVELWYRYSNDNYSWGKNWWHTSWRYRKLITIDSSKVITDLFNFPVLILETFDNDLASHAQNDGDDIVFVLYSDNITKLNHEKQLYNGSTGKLIAWVKIPILDSTSDTKIWMYYGNPLANNQDNAHGVWDSNFVAIWHLDESPDDNIAGHFDSTAYNNHGTPKNFQDGGGGSTDAVGKIGSADYFAGDDDWIEIPHSSSLDVNGNQVSLSAWIKMTALQDNDEGIIVKSDGSNYNMQLGVQGDERANFRVKTTTGTTYLTGITTLQVNQWYYLYGVYNGTTTNVFLNDFVDGTENRIGNIVSPVAPVVLGRRALGDDRFFRGIIDEARISYIARSTEWFETEFNNQNSPSTFYNIGSPEEFSKNWTSWISVINPDNSHPWSWSFDFPNGEGYYQFYSIGIYNDFNEVAPDSSDALCCYKPGTIVDPIIPFNQTMSPSTITATGDNSFDNVVLYYRFSDDNSSWDVSSGEIIWSSELLINPSFETGDSTGWSNGGGGTLTVGTNCPLGSQSPYEGTFYSYWLTANENVNAYAYQDVNLNSYATDIDAGRAKINVTGWFVSDEYNFGAPPPYDEFFMNVKFYDASNAVITGYGYESGGNNPISQGSGNHVSNWDRYGITNYDIPIGTRKVRVSYYTWEYSGSNFYDGGSADNFSVVIGIISVDSNWTEFGTDYSYPWSWDFNFLNGTGYYGFYSIGKKDGSQVEQTPSTADAICHKD